MVTTNELISIQGLTKKYGDKVALDSLDLSIPSGQILGLIGPNGAGKTTTIKILVGLARPTSGTAHVAGVDCVRNAKKIKRMVGYMPDKFGSYENMRVLEYLDFFGAAFGLKRRDRRRRIEEVMEMSGTTYMRDMLVDSLSHGMSQRLGITRTLLHDPQVLILDEPANGLDPLARIEMRELLLKLADAGKTLLVTSHILPELSRICHRIAILAQGRLRACGNVAEISRQISPRRTMEVQLSSEADVSQAAEVIRRHMEEEAEVVPAPTERLVRCRTLKSEAELGELLATLVASGIQVTQFRELQTDLEEAFMTFARESAEDVVPEASVPAESEG
ncbi:MAG: ABC transporter ATP-binding protein [Planctomycetaceae bacterium]|nr:ABC transporter ATP-binding protein [Planctomycetaceae bacterium]